MLKSIYQGAFLLILLIGEILIHKFILNLNPRMRIESWKSFFKFAQELIGNF
jgi:hypothetical protein